MKLQDVFYEIHSDNLREGPGDDDSTKKALSFIKNLPEIPLILDIGCGPGMQTLVLAIETRGIITAIDTYDPYLKDLNKKTKKEDLANMIKVINMSMFDMDFHEESFDLIWSEGAIYIIGFKSGLQNWRKYLKYNGYCVVTEISWLCDSIPNDLKAYWMNAYPEMKSINDNIKLIKEIGYSIIDHFILPESSWWANYYDPIEKKLKNLENKYKDLEGVLEIIKAEKTEMEMYRKYSKYYGYVFYIMQKI